MNEFYTAEPIKEQVSKEEFVKFINNYPRKLVRDVCGICDPPSITYNDFALANRWPYSVVAHTWAYDDNPGDYFYKAPEDKTYIIVTNYQELFDSKTGYMAE